MFNSWHAAFAASTTRARNSLSPSRFDALFYFLSDTLRKKGLLAPFFPALLNPLTDTRSQGRATFLHHSTTHAAKAARFFS
jgi:hypothetical protein